MKTLKDFIQPDYELGWYKKDKELIRNLEVKIVEHHGIHSDERLPVEFRSKYIYNWVVLENGLLVGFNENPSHGWSYEVRRTRS